MGSANNRSLLNEPQGVLGTALANLCANDLPDRDGSVAVPAAPSTHSDRIHARVSKLTLAREQVPMDRTRPKPAPARGPGCDGSGQAAGGGRIPLIRHDTLLFSTS